MSSSGCCPNSGGNAKKKIDYLLWGSLIFLLLVILLPQLPALGAVSWLYELSHASLSLIKKMWWGLALGVVFVGVLSHVPREVVMSVLGSKQGLGGILRATFAGLLLDLCNHGILLVGMKFYERGASTAQTMAFLIASPWNSFSVTFVLWALVGLKWTLVFVVLSGVIAILSGLIFELLEKKKVLAPNPNRLEVSADFSLGAYFKEELRWNKWRLSAVGGLLFTGLKESRMILRWILFGTALAVLIQVFVPSEVFKEYFGPTLLGLGATLVAATVIEVCSEGSTPIAADVLNRAAAPGNAFAFLMAGASTDYTEIMALKESTGGWKKALFLPLVTLPQILALAYVLNAA